MHLKILCQDRWTVCALASDEHSKATCQIEEFLGSLEAEHEGSADGMLQLLEYVAQNGPRQLPDPLSHYVDQNERIWEFIKGRLRILWFYDEGQIVVCTHGFIKSSQKTKKADKKLAIETRKAYLAAKAAGTLKMIARREQ